MTKLRKIRPERPSYDSPVVTTPAVYYPTFSLSLKDLPEAKDIEVGSTCEIEMMVRLKSRTEGDFGGNIVFEIREIAIDNDEDDKSK